MIGDKSTFEAYPLDHENSRKILDDNRIFLATLADAIDAGYKLGGGGPTTSYACQTYGGGGGPLPDVP